MDTLAAAKIPKRGAGAVLSTNAIAVLKRRYLVKNEKQEVAETPAQLFRRVASCVASAETLWTSSVSQKEVEQRFHALMQHLDFLPNSPTLMNAGADRGQLSACFAVPVDDSMEGIFKALAAMAKIHQSGGGTGFDFSHLRPQGDCVYSTMGRASGPVSFMNVFDQATGVIMQGGRRRGANMGVLRCDHPDILDFIEAKLDPARFNNFNLSVGMTDAFMEAYQKNQTYPLINPRTKKAVKKLKARDVFNLIVKCAWQTGDPGLIFLDEINRTNPLPGLGTIEATNPCGELPLLPYESCNLGSINLSRMVDGKDVDWTKLAECVKWGVRFLDDVIEVNHFPMPEIREITRANRKIGLGVMGFADMLIRLKISYGSQEAVKLAEVLMQFIREESVKTSLELARERGVFPNFDKSIHAKNYLRLRNATLNSIAPTGTISMIAGCSSGIEPLFAVSFIRNVLSGSKLFEMNPLFIEETRKQKIYSKSLARKIAGSGSLKKVKEIPADLRQIFLTAFDVRPEQHLRIQAAFQKYTDNAVSKTINLLSKAAISDVKKIYLSAYSLKCKGITVYRYGSRKNQVLRFDHSKNQNGHRRQRRAGAETDDGEGCAKGVCAF